MKINRRQSRETAFLLIFEWGFRKEETLDEVIAQAQTGRELVVDKFAHELASRTVENCAELDETIVRYSQKWKLNRIPRVTLTALRMSFCELSMFPEIPVGATINEAVELVKKFATEEDAAYLNGILGQYERDRTGKSGDPAADGDESAEAGEAPTLPQENQEQEDEAPALPQENQEQEDEAPALPQENQEQEEAPALPQENQEQEEAPALLQENQEQEDEAPVLPQERQEQEGEALADSEEASGIE